MKKGFTLIELLAVIVILAIIALIATPIVLNIIKDTRESTNLRSAEMYLDAVEQAVSVEKMKNTNFKPNECTITDEGNLLCDNTDILDIKIDGNKPVNGSITFEKGKIKKATLEYKNDKVIVMNTKGKLQYQKYISINNYQHKHIDGTIGDHEVTFDANGHGICSICMEEVLAAGLYDENDDLVASWDSLVNDYGLDITVDGIGLVVPQGQSSDKLLMRIIYLNTELQSTTKVVIDDSVTLLGTSQFYNNTNIKEIIIPNSVTRIGYSAFTGCTSLKSLEIPDSVTAIGGFVFANCSSLTTITIPDSVTSIVGNAFYGCTGLESVKIGKGVTSIGDYAFQNCTGLTSITIGDSVESIGIYAFFGCTNLETINLPDNLKKINYSAFNGCKNLSSIYIPATVTTFVYGYSETYGAFVSGCPAFYDCSSTLKIYTGVKEGEIPSGWGSYWNYYDSSNTLKVIYGVTREEYEAIVNGA